MAWKEERKIKLNFKRDVKRAHDLSVVFGVPESKRTEFNKVLQDFLKITEQLKAVCKVKNEVLDSETYEPVSIELEFYGSKEHGGQQQLVQELQRRGDAFINASDWLDEPR